MVGKTIKLNSGYEVPTVGYGTFQSNDAEQLKVGLRAALEAGYRHIDTAYGYFNEHVIGEVLQEFFDSGKLKREELFITTKIFGSHFKPDVLIRTLKSQIEKLRSDYVDLYLLHFPTALVEPDVPGQFAKMTANGKFVFDTETKLEDTWHAMEQAVELGLAKSIGISNFNISQVERMLKCKIKPAVNQIEFHPGFQNKKLVDYCQANGVTVTAYSQFGSPGTKNMVTGKLLIEANYLEDERIGAIAKKHGKNNAQVILRWVMQKGIMVIPKSVTPARIVDNFNVWDFELTPEECKVLDSMDTNKRSFLLDYFGLPEHPEYPHKEAGSC